jgi:hypothetical protein
MSIVEIYDIQVSSQCCQHVFVGQCVRALLHVWLVNTRNDTAVVFVMMMYL